MSSGIYKITNIKDGSIYIGQSKCIETRFQQHKNPGEWKKRGYKNMLYNAFQKYGVENFTFEIIEYCDSKLQRNEAEKKWIQYYHCYIYDNQYEKGYNMTPGGDGRDSEELKKWWEKVDKDVKQKILNSMAEKRRGVPMPQEAKKILSEKQKAFRQEHPLTEQEKYNIAKRMSKYTVIAYDENDNIVGKFPSIHYALAKFLQFSSCGPHSYDAILKSIQNKTLYHGYYWRIVDEKI